MRANTETKNPHHSFTKEFDVMTSTNDNKKSSDESADDSAASARPYKLASKEEIEHNIANIMWIADTKVRAQMQTEVGHRCVIRGARIPLTLL